MTVNTIVRKIDELGRIVIPKEIRDVFNINIGDDIVIKVEGANVILEKQEERKSNG